MHDQAPPAPLPETPDAAAIEEGRILFAGLCEFVAGAGSVETLPPLGATEVAFAGRSNVGKSSLVNALTGRRTLARTSHTPGRTREINFFRFGTRLILADLPGYGYAQAAKSDIQRWTDMVNAYLKGRPTLRRVCLLIDARHGLKPPDIEVMKMLDTAAVSYQIVLTKTDKVKVGELQARLDALHATLAKHTAAHPDIIATSVREGAGIELLRAVLATLAAPKELG